MIKVCYISALLGIEKRGIESYSIGLIKNLKKLDNELEFTLVTGGVVKEEFIKNNYIYPIKPKVLKGFFGSNYVNDRLAIFAISPGNIYHLICSFSLLKFLIKNKFNYYIPTNYFDLIMCRIARFLKKESSKIIFVGHAGPGHDDYKALKLGPDIFVELTKPSFEWAKKRALKKTKVVLLPVGIDTEKFNSTTTLIAKNPFKNDNSIVLFIGAFVPYKRPELAIKLIESNNSLNLIMIGHGPLLEQLKIKYRNLVKQGRLYFTGSIDHTQIPSYIKLSDLLVMTSTDRENSPGVTIEAMTMGKPVVATKYDRTDWIIGNGGVLTNPKNIAEFSKAVNLVLNNYKKYTTEARSRSKYFWWKNVAKGWDKLFV